MDSGLPRYSDGSQGVVLRTIFGLLCKAFCLGYVFLLCLFAASDKEENHQAPDTLKVDSVTRTVIDTQFADAFTDRLCISKVAQRKAANTDLDARPCLL